MKVNIHFLPNLQVPVVVNNTGGWVWQGDAMKLTNAELGKFIQIPVIYIHFF